MPSIVVPPLCPPSGSKRPSRSKSATVGVRSPPPNARIGRLCAAKSAGVAVVSTTKFPETGRSVAVPNDSRIETAPDAGSVAHEPFAAAVDDEIGLAVAVPVRDERHVALERRPGRR